MIAINQLIEFARKHHKSFEPFTDEAIEAFFEKYQDTTKVRFDEKGNITGFAVWDEQPDKIVFIVVAGVGDRRENYRVMMKQLRQFKKPVSVFSEKGQKWVSKLVRH